MRFDAVQRILGVLLMVFSLTMLPPAVISLGAGDGAHGAFVTTTGVLVFVGFSLWLPVRALRRELRIRDGFFIVAMFWLVLGVAGAVPFLLDSRTDMGVTDAVFESISGLTTTGATVLTGIEELPLSVRYYRQQLQWLGGMGIIVLAVAILPMLGIGGMQLYRAELPGPVKDAKLTPRITETAKALWYIYLSLTVICGVAYWIAGMSVFDAVGHAFSTIATGGFSTHDASMGHFDSVLIEMIAVLFMFISSVNYSLHFLVWRWRTVEPWIRDPELRFYVGILVTACVLVTGGLYIYETGLGIDDPDLWHHGLFQVMSFATTTGYTTTGHQLWPAFLPVLLLFLSFIGGCGSSTSGGIKVVRVLLLLRQGGREILRLIHPQAVLPVKLGEKPVSDRVTDAVWGFFAAYVALFTVIMLSLMAMGLDQVTAFSATASGMNNLGPALGDVATHFGGADPAVKLVICLAMVLGRLEIFTLLVLFTPAFWRR